MSERLAVALPRDGPERDVLRDARPYREADEAGGDGEEAEPRAVARDGLGHPGRERDDATAAAALLLQPSWHVGLALVLAAAAAVLLVSTLVPLPPSVRRGRLGDVAELVALVSLLPLLVFAIGVVGAV